MKMSEETGETCAFASLQGVELIAMDVAKGRNEFAYDLMVGDRVPVHCCAVGRAIIAKNSDARAALVIKSIRPMTDRTITHPLTYLAELKKIASQGYAVVDRERTDDLTCCGAALVESNSCVRSGIGVCGRSSRIDQQMSREIGQYVAHRCSTLSKALQDYQQR